MLDDMRGAVRGPRGLLLVAMLALLLWHLVLVVGGGLALGIRPANLNWTLVVAVAAAFAFLNAWWLMGLRRALAFFVVTAVISVVIEYIGVKTGVIFGRYYYTPVLQPKLFDTVPIAIPLAYFLLVHANTVMANLAVDGVPTRPKRSFVRDLGVAGVVALATTAWDLNWDPMMSGPVGAWTWLDGGPYFGVPLLNFGGWIVTVFVIVAVSFVVDRLQPASPPQHSSWWMVALLILGYATFPLYMVVLGEPTGTRCVGPPAMGGLILVSLLHVVRLRKQAMAGA